MTSRKKSIVFSLITVVVTVGLSVGGFELALRVMGRPFKGTLAPAEESIAQFDSETGWSYIPNRSAKQKFGDAQVEVSMHFDELGTRVQTAGATRAADRQTILLVGGSFTMGHGVSYEDSIAGQLEKQMPAYQVVNAAVQGFGTDQSLVQLRRFIDRYDTKAVVYGFVCDHLRRNAYEDRRILMPGRRFPGTKPAFRVEGDGVVQIHQPIATDELSYSRLWAYVRIVRAHRGAPPTGELTRGLIRAMNDTAKAKGAAFVAIDWEIRGTPELCAIDPLAGLDVPLIRPAKNAPEGWSTWFIPGDYHPSPPSHAHVAKLVAQRLHAAGLH